MHHIIQLTQAPLQEMLVLIYKMLGYFCPVLGQCLDFFVCNHIVSFQWDHGTAHNTMSWSFQELHMQSKRHRSDCQLWTGQQNTLNKRNATRVFIGRHGAHWNP
jgi:hypothetical protein